jgi:hypothetical protein
MSEPVSGAPYIIICSVETEVALAENRKGQVTAASNGAAQLVGWMQAAYKNFNPVDAQSISTIQHQLMDWAKGEVELTHEQVDQKVAALIDELRVLEDKY